MTRRTLAAALGATALALTAPLTTLAAPDPAVAASTASLVERAPVPDGSASLRVVTVNTDFGVSDRAFLDEMTRIDELARPDVILAQETGRRTTIVPAWAHAHGYHLYFPKGRRRSNDHESIVLWSEGTRFQLVSESLHAGSRGNHRAGPRPIESVVVRDGETGRTYRLSSTHADPDVVWGDDGAPRRGTPTLRDFRVHMRNVRSVALDARRAGQLEILGGDFNVDVTASRRWAGFPEKEFGDLLTTNQYALGRIMTHHGRHGGGSAIDYVWTARTPAVQYLSQWTIPIASDHDAVVVDLAVTKATAEQRHAATNKPATKKHRATKHRTAKRHHARTHHARKHHAKHHARTHHARTHHAKRHHAKRHHARKHHAKHHARRHRARRRH